MNTIDEKYQDGCLLIELNKMEKANEIFLQIIKENPDYYQALNKMGVICAKGGNLYRAQDYFERALDINNKYAPALVNLGNILKESGRIDEAKNFYLAAIEEEPDYAIAYRNMAVLYKEENSYEMYMKYIKEYRKANRRAYRRQSFSKEIRRKNLKGGKIGMLINITLVLSLTLIIIFWMKAIK